MTRLLHLAYRAAAAVRRGWETVAVAVLTVDERRWRA